MAAPVCELCGSTDFVKTDGMFVCQGCKTKYTPEEARALMRVNAVASPAEQAAQTCSKSSEAAVAEPNSTADFAPETVQANVQDPRLINNYICTGFKLLMDEYRCIEHPDRNAADTLLAQAKQCVTILDAATQLSPNDHTANLLIFKNCAEIEDALQHTEYFEQDSEGEWKRRNLFFENVRLPGQKESWSEKGRYHRNFLEQEFVDIYTPEWQRKLELESAAQALQADIAELKDEKRSKGLFNFAEKREVKDRMKPVKDELSAVNAQIREIERKVERFVEGKLETLATSYTRLDF